MAIVIQLIKDGKVEHEFPREDVKLAFSSFYSILHRKQYRQEDGPLPKYKANTIYQTDDGKRALIKLADKKIASSAISSDEPWYVLYLISKSSGDMPIKRGQKEKTIITKLNALGVWVDSFELGKEYTAENGLTFKVEKVDKKPEDRMRTVSSFRNTDRIKTTNEPKTKEISYTRKERDGSSSNLISEIVRKIDSERPFFVSRSNLSGRTTIADSDVVKSIKEKENVTYWITLNDSPVLFRTEDGAWYIIGKKSDFTDPVLLLLITLVKPTQYND